MFDNDLGNWNISDVKYDYGMFWMFENCHNFKGIGLEKWKLTRNCKKKMCGIFNGCKSLIKYPKWYDYLNDYHFKK